MGDISIPFHSTSASDALQRNRIEHRLFAFITQNWRGKPLVSHEVIVQLIGNTTTKTGLNLLCRIDDKPYPKGITVSDAELKAVNLTQDDFHGE